MASFQCSFFLLNFDLQTQSVRFRTIDDNAKNWLSKSILCIKILFFSFVGTILWHRLCQNADRQCSSSMCALIVHIAYAARNQSNASFQNRSLLSVKMDEFLSLSTIMNCLLLQTSYKYNKIYIYINTCAYIL